MHSSSDNMKFTSYSDASEVIDKLFESVCSRYQGNLESSMRGSDFTFDSVQLLYYKCQKKATINPKNTDDKCFQYAATVELNYEDI